MNTVIGKEIYAGAACANFMQSPEWADVKAGWKHEYVTAERGGAVAGSMLILVKELKPLGTAFCYAPRGPVCDMHDRGVLEELVGKAAGIARGYRAFVLKIDPLIDESDEEAIENLTSLGFVWAPEKVGYDNIQCRENYVLNIAGKSADEVFSGFHRKCRYNIRLAERRGVTCGFYGAERLDDFMELMRQTAERDGFHMRAKSYYAKLLGSFGGKARLCLCDLDGEALSGALCIEYADRLSYVYGCSSNDHRNCMPNYLMQWTMIRDACAKGLSVYDFQGVPYWYDARHRNYGVYRFKSGFRGAVKTYAGEFDLCLRPVLSTIFNVAWGLKKRMTHLGGALRDSRTALPAAASAAAPAASALSPKTSPVRAEGRIPA